MGALFQLWVQLCRNRLGYANMGWVNTLVET